MKKMDYLIERLNRISKSTWMLLAIIIVGIFLRTYNFHIWLDFENDQSRDAILVSDVLAGKTPWPLLGPTMRGSQDAQNTLFHLGPIYYYFQIISGEIFGNYPDKLAYPDLLFSILTIPLFYFFIKKYFSVNLSLALTGLFSISFFAIEYSRFAWNPNSLPFFSLLFLLSLYEFLLNQEKTNWRWAIALGVAIGVGMQLHIITALLFGAVAFLVAIYLLETDWRVWKKIALVFVVVIVLNLPQLYSELQTGFSNSKIFLYSATDENAAVKKRSSVAQKIGLDLNCHMENNLYILSSYGSSECISSYGIAARKIFHYKYKKVKNAWHQIIRPEVAMGLIVGFIFSLAGYFLLLFRAWKEEDEKKKIFLRLVSFYAAVSFLIMLPLAEKFVESRYLIQVFFVPFFFLGLISDFLMRKFSKKYATAIIIILFSTMAFFNLKSLYLAVKELHAGTKSDVHFAILGEMEKMVKYMIDNAGGQRKVYLVGDKPYRAHFFQPFWYLAEKEGVDMVNVGTDSQPISSGNAIFYLTDAERKREKHISGYVVESYKVFGKVAVYKLVGI